MQLLKHYLSARFIVNCTFLTVFTFLSILYIFKIAHAEPTYAYEYLADLSFNSVSPSVYQELSQVETATQTATNTATPTSTEQINPTSTHTPTSSSTSTSTPLVEATETPTLPPNPTITSTNTEIASNTTMLYGPIIANHLVIEPAEIVIDDYLICDSLSSPMNIPENDSNGVSDDILVVEDGIIVDLEIYLNVDHTWIGDLQISLSLDQTEYSSTLVDRPGIPGSTQGCGLDNLRMIMDDQASQPAEDKCLNYPAAQAGIYQPSTQLAVFRGLPASGKWILNISDNSPADSGHLNNWCLHFSLSSRMPPPTPTPIPSNLPESARIYDISGQDQALPLDCESRSAVDWANYFGTKIGELEFLNLLPNSDNPDLGFVGDVNGTWGQIPPNDYGVHAGPVADLLTDYGLNAKAQKSLSWDDIRREISESKPVIAWVIGSVINGAPAYYESPSSPKTSIVARYEHTVIIIGYTQDSVIILDGDNIYTRSLDRFLESWSALNNMAILAETSEN